MSVQTTLSDFRIDYACDILQLPDTVGLRYYNDGRDALIDSIIEEKEDYFYNFNITPTVIGQNEYIKPKRGDLATDGITVLDGMHKIKQIGVKLKASDVNYTILTPTTIENLPKDIDSYAQTVSPFYLLQDNSYFIYPTPTEISSIKVQGITYPKKLTLTDAETIQDQYSKVIIQYVAYRYLTSTNQLKEAQLAKGEFEAELIRIGRNVSGRIQAPVQRTVPNLTSLS